MNSVKNYKQTKFEKIRNAFYSKIYKETKYFMKQNPDIIVTTADKGQKTVILTTDEYKNKARRMLNDKNTYKKVARNPTTRYEKESNAIIEKWYKNLKISENTKEKLLTKNSTPPRIYFLPKIHKNERPFRPIVSYTNAPTYKLSKYLSEVLSKVLGKKDYSINNSEDFVNKIKNKEVIAGHQILSLDVTSLYTNISIDLVMHTLKHYWKKIKEHTDLSYEELTEGIKLCLETTYFLYDKEYYQQIFGCAMGTPISATIANLVMELLEETCLKDLPTKPSFYYRYVDDIILTYPKEKINELLTIFNNYDKFLSFTHEDENSENSIAFLDVLLTRQENNTINLNWYNKPTNSWRYIHFHSNHPLEQKGNIIHNTIRKARAIANEEFHSENMTKIKNAFIKNGYPRNFIDGIIRDSSSNTDDNKGNDDKNNKQDTRYVKIPYNNKASKIFKKILKTYNITPAFSTSNTGNKLCTNTKAAIRPLDRNNVIYRIDCNECDKCYIGCTSQPLKLRINQHKSDQSKKPNSTALARHSNEKNHTFNYEKTKILETEHHQKKRLLAEMLHIKTTNNACNSKKDTSDLPPQYDSIINKM